jgi:hypothetical protein
MSTGIVNIRGKEYQTVALRVQKFREAHPNWSLTSEVLFRDQNCVVMKSIIADETGRVLATGHAEEYRNSSQINGTSALENAETSAHGRSLAALGISGTEFASADEVQNAIHQQNSLSIDAKSIISKIKGAQDEAELREHNIVAFNKFKNDPITFAAISAAKEAKKRELGIP